MILLLPLEDHRYVKYSLCGSFYQSFLLFLKTRFFPLKPSFFFFKSVGHIAWHVGSLFLDQGWNSCPLLWSINRWTACKVQKPSLRKCMCYTFLLGSVLCGSCSWLFTIINLLIEISWFPFEVDTISLFVEMGDYDFPTVRLFVGSKI